MFRCIYGEEKSLEKLTWNKIRLAIW
jgi:hypothetical protein